MIKSRRSRKKRATKRTNTQKKCKGLIKMKKIMKFGVIGASVTAVAWFIKNHHR